MKLYVSSLILSSIISVGLAAPRNAHLEERQRDKTYTITCLGPLCTDYPPTTVRIPTTIVIPSFPGGENPKTTSTIKSTPPKTTVPPTSKKTSTTTKYTPPAETSKYTPPPTTKTVKSTAVPTKTTAQPGGPSSTKCPVPRYYQCGGYFEGKEWTGCSVCEPGSDCVFQNDFYYQCVEDV
ncbi:carbohydrate-binding module family 1 protein [Melanomma pulvis-pyrius CBS 109.77]|uniref:Carbohydrate-binding module family 1 protein n=1 Tax=Melanomma pulvis-pyrius CBS 109.77 TaxID=1314802 RepID=A0A6A6XRU4_9PLEO|nr:carbohydrate-binding module family 1 protein [Melanomma pulvis-pyrius CBS 109.77]